MEFVRTRLQRNVVHEIALSAAATDDGILRAPDVLDRALNWVAAGEVRVGTPKLAGMIHIFAAGSGENADLFAYRKVKGGFGGSLLRV
jgi:hypothetical protein